MPRVTTTLVCWSCARHVSVWDLGARAVVVTARQMFPPVRAMSSKHRQDPEVDGAVSENTRFTKLTAERSNIMHQRLCTKGTEERFGVLLVVQPLGSLWHSHALGHTPL